jgi:hypothetical protein
MDPPVIRINHHLQPQHTLPDRVVRFWPYGQKRCNTRGVFAQSNTGAPSAPPRREVSGRLTMHGITREITLAVEQDGVETRDPWRRLRRGDERHDVRIAIGVELVQSA